MGDLVKVDAMIDRPTAEVLAKAVEAGSRRTSDDVRTRDVRRADAFSALVMTAADSGLLPQQGRVKPHVNLTMSLDQLAGIDGAGPLLERFGRVPAATGARLACDGVWTRIVLDPHGEVLDVGRLSRHTTAAQTKAIRAMFTVCGYPNCTVPVSRCDIHHVRWWSRGGPTDLWNLLPLCKHHHLFVHEYGYTIEVGLDDSGQPRSGPGRWVFLSPRGRPIFDHRSSLGRFIEQLTLVPDPSRADGRRPDGREHDDRVSLE